MLIKVHPDKEKVKSIMNMVEITLERINATDKERFSSNITKDYYDVIRELISVVLLLDGCKAYGDYANREMIDYLEKNKKEFKKQELLFINDLRMKRNKITYDGFFVKPDFLKRNIEKVNNIITKLKQVINQNYG